MAGTLKLKDPKLFRETCYINGEWVGAGSNETIDVTNPGDRRITRYHSPDGCR